MSRVSALRRRDMNEMTSLCLVRTGQGANCAHQAEGPHQTPRLPVPDPGLAASVTGRDNGLWSKPPTCGVVTAGLPMTAAVSALVNTLPWPTACSPGCCHPSPDHASLRPPSANLSQ